MIAQHGNHLHFPSHSIMIFFHVVLLYFFSSLFFPQRTLLLIIPFLYLMVYFLHDNPFLRALLAWVAVIILLFGMASSSLHQRDMGLSQANTSDALIIMESAGQLFLDGKNPYAETYFGTELQKIDDLNEERVYWKKLGLDHNPAMYHFVYPPGAFLIPAAFMGIVGPVDLRMLFLPFELLSLILLFVFIRNWELKILATLVVCALYVFGGLYIGVMDIFLISLAVIALILMQRNHHLTAALMLGVVGTIKQNVWMLLLLVLIWAYWQKKLKTYLVAPLIVGVVILAFFLWNPPAFVDDSISFFAGSTEYAYPINFEQGGFPYILRSIGFSREHVLTFPYFLVQALVLIPLLWYFGRKLKHANEPHHVYVYAGVLLYGLFLFYKFPHFNYFNFAITLFAIGFLFILDQHIPSSSAVKQPTKID